MFTGYIYEIKRYLYYIDIKVQRPALEQTNKHNAKVNLFDSHLAHGTDGSSSLASGGHLNDKKLWQKCIFGKLSKSSEEKNN